MQRVANAAGRRKTWALASVALIGLAARPAAAQTAQTAPPANGEVDLARIFAAVPPALERVLAKGNTEFFRLLENVELFHIESEIDRMVGGPRTLNDSTIYKVSLLPFHIRYPIYRQLVDQMTRLDSVRSLQIHMVTPDSVSLVDLKIQPILTLDAMNGEGASGEIQRSLLGHFSARELADLSVFLLAQQPFFPESDQDWQRTKHQIARAGVPIALGALAAGAAFDAGALGHSATIFRQGDDLRLRYYAGFRGLGVHMRPYLRGGLAVRAFRFEAAAGLADQVRPTATEPDQAVELALREGWLSQLVRPAGVDAFFEAAVKRAIVEPAAFPGDRTRARAGLFFKRDQVPAFPTLTLRGSLEGESNLTQQRHLVAALGVERPRSGITTVLQGSRTLTPPTGPAGAGAGAGTGAGEESRLSLFLVGSMEPFSALFSEDMVALARRCHEEWLGLVSLDARREAWDQALLARGTAGRSADDARATLAEMERLLVEREERLLRVGATLAEYLESRRRAYAILGRDGAPDDLHGPLDARVLIAARERILGRLQDLSVELTGRPAPLLAMRDRMTAIQREIRDLEFAQPDSQALAAERRALLELQQRWYLDAERIRAQLSAREQLRTQGIRILTAMGRREDAIRQWDMLGERERLRIARLALYASP